MDIMLFILILTHFVKNAGADLSYAIRGKMPPRHLERMERLRQQGQQAERSRAGAPAPISQSGFRRYWGGLWDDSWRDAHDRRQRKRAQKGKTPTVADAVEPLEAAEDERIEAGELGRVASQMDQERVDRAFQQAKNASDAAQWRRRRAQIAEAAGKGLVEPTVPDSVPALDDEPATTPTDPPLATVTPINTKEPLMSGETLNVDAARAYVEALSAKAAENITSLETSIAALTSRQVTGPAVEALASVQEKFVEIVAELSVATAAFDRHAQLADAYAANADAGDKDYLTHG